MVLWLSRQGARHPRWRIFFGIVFAGMGVAYLVTGRTGQSTWTWLGGGWIALGVMSVLMGVLGLFAGRFADPAR
jgi:uncharacterized membrane protein YjjP (DUF1212 family)